MVSKQDSAKWNEIVAQSIDDQANVFLRAFALEFSGGGFEEVLDIASQFKRFAPKEGVPDLEEHKAHLFLERRGETLTVQQLRLTLKDIDVDNNNRVAFLEYALFKWKKTPQQFFVELAKPQKVGAALEAAIAEYRKVIATREARENKIEELKADAAAGGVKGAKAKNELAQLLHEDQLHQNKAEITTAAKKRAAEKVAIDPYAEEQKRLEEEKKKKEAEEKAKQDESRAKLKAKTSLWENK